jgi:multiple sugar transport system permease protein
MSWPHLLPYALIAPLVITIGVLVIWPLVFTTTQAFTSAPFGEESRHFVGLANFAEVVVDPQVRTSWGNTALYVLIGVGLSTALGTVIAMALRVPFRGRGALLALVALPWALPAVVEGLMWQSIYDANQGALNAAMKGLHLIDHYHLWLGLDRIQTVALIELSQVWQITPIAVFVILPALQQIPDELYEAASVDGARRWSQIFRITLPLARPGIALAAVTCLVISINVFDQVYALNGGAPLGSSIALQIYTIAFADLDFPKAYALGLILLLVTAGSAVFLMRVLYRRVEF